MRWLLLTLLAASPVAAQDGALQAKVEAALAEAGPGTRIGLVVLDDAGRDVVAIHPDDRFVPASNTKIFTTAAAFALLPVDTPDVEGGAAVRMEEHDVVLVGHGDARLSSAADCVTDCLATLADAVAARTRRVRDVIGDDSLFPDERWSPGMSWNNIATRSGTGISALTLDDNELIVTVTPGAAGKPPAIDALPFYRIDNRAVTTSTGKSDIGFDRMPGSDLLRVTGGIAAGGEPVRLRVGIDDPAAYAAFRLRALLVARGVRVTGVAGTRHRPPGRGDDPAARGDARAAHPPEPPALAVLTPPPLAADVTLTNKVSQNLHAELLLRRIGIVNGSGSIADGQHEVTRLLTDAGVERWRYDFADGSGMSSYNRVSPRGVARFLRWTASQRWGAAWHATLPVGGVDGTLRRRFAGTPLDGRLFAKTGSLDKASALAGFMTAASGRTLTFAAYANDMPQDAPATKAMDAALLIIAAAR